MFFLLEVALVVVEVLQTLAAHTIIIMAAPVVVGDIRLLNSKLI
nr:MAG TPA: hypothetical protein [Bacteriophage sp.]